MTLRWSSDEVVGSKVAGYQIEGLIGRGGMGAVYRAQEVGLGRRVALKVIAPELADRRNAQPDKDADPRHRVGEEQA